MKSSTQTKKRICKIAIILFLLSISATTIISYGRFDAFFPWNITELLSPAYLGTIETPTQACFEILFSTTCMILGISPTYMLSFPILILPLFLLSGLILYKISKNGVVSILLTLILYCTFNSAAIYVMWIHASGTVQYLLILYLLYLGFVNVEKSNKIPAILCLVLTLISLNFGSYNYMALSAITIVVFFGLLCFTSVFNTETRTISLKCILKPSYILFLIIIVLVIFLIFGANSFYQTFFYFIENMSTSGVSGIEKLLSSVFDKLSFIDSATIIDTPLAPYHFTVSTFTTSLWGTIIRYGIYGITFLAYGYWILKTYILNRNAIETVDLFIIAVILGSAIFGLIRTVFVGQPNISFLYLGTVFIIARLWVRKPAIFVNHKFPEKIIIFLFVALLVLGHCGGSLESAIDEPNNLQSIPETQIVAIWSNNHSTNQVSSDVFTFGMLGLSTIIDNVDNTGIFSSSHNYRCFSGSTEILSVLDPTICYSDKSNIVMNYALPQVSVSIYDWVTLKPWVEYKQEITYNSNYNTVHSSGNLDYLVSVEYVENTDNTDKIVGAWMLTETCEYEKHKTISIKFNGDNTGDVSYTDSDSTVTYPTLWYTLDDNRYLIEELYSVILSEDEQTLVDSRGKIYELDGEIFGGVWTEISNSDSYQTYVFHNDGTGTAKVYENGELYIDSNILWKEWSENQIVFQVAYPYFYDGNGVFCTTPDKTYVRVSNVWVEVPLSDGVMTTYEFYDNGFVVRTNINVETNEIESENWMHWHNREEADNGEMISGRTYTMSIPEDNTLLCDRGYIFKRL